MVDLSSKNQGKTFRSSRSTLYVAPNKYGSLTLGIISGLTSVSQVDQINKCLPSQWRVKKVTASKGRRSNIEGKNVEMFLNMLSKVIKLVCKYKNKIKKFFGKKLNLRNSKVFLQMSNAQWGWRNFRNVVKTFKANIKNVKRITKKAGNVWNKVQKVIKRTIGKIKGLFLMFKNQLQKILPLKFVKQLVKKTVPCLKRRLAKTGKQIVKVIRGVARKISTIASRGFAGLASVFIDLICQFDKFRAATHELIRGLNESNESRKYFYYGSFAGQIVNIIGKARFLRMGLFLMKY